MKVLNAEMDGRGISARLNKHTEICNCMGGSVRVTESQRGSSFGVLAKIKETV